VWPLPLALVSPEDFFSRGLLLPRTSSPEDFAMLASGNSETASGNSLGK
jgi:hypothetical protein